MSAGATESPPLREPTTAAPETAAVRAAFERGLDWMLGHSEHLTPDARVAALAALHLLDRPRAEELRSVLLVRPEPRLTPIGKILDTLSFGRVSRRLRERPTVTDALLDRLAADPAPLAWSDDPADPPAAPGTPPESAEELHRIDGERSNAAVGQALTGRFEPSVLGWLRRDDLWGYDLAHQLFAWTLAARDGAWRDEALVRVPQLAWRLFQEHRRGPAAVHYDLFAERTAFLSLAGFPAGELVPSVRATLEAQGEDGGWWFTRDPADQADLIERVHLGASPLVPPGRSAKSYREAPDPDQALRRLTEIHRGHPTGLSLWTLGISLHRSTRA